MSQDSAVRDSVESPPDEVDEPENFEVTTQEWRDYYPAPTVSLLNQNGPLEASPLNLKSDSPMKVAFNDTDTTGLSLGNDIYGAPAQLLDRMSRTVQNASDTTLNFGVTTPGGDSPQQRPDLQKRVDEIVEGIRQGDPSSLIRAVKEAYGNQPSVMGPVLEKLAPALSQIPGVTASYQNGNFTISMRNPDGSTSRAVIRPDGTTTPADISGFFKRLEERINNPSGSENEPEGDIDDEDEELPEGHRRV